MKILLVRPQPQAETIGLQHVMVCEPLELEYAAAVAKEMGHQAELADMILDKRSLERIIIENMPDLVGITAYISHIRVVQDYASRIRKLLPGCRIAVGGVHAEVVPEDFTGPNIDYIISRDPLNTWKEIILNVTKGDKDTNIPGIYPAAAARDDAAAIPLLHPDRLLSRRYRKEYYYLFHRPCALIKTSYGCPYECSFCFCRQITGGKYSVRELEDVLDELGEIEERDIYIVDDNFLVSRERVLRFCRLLRERGLDKRFLIYGRSDFIAANPDCIEEFAACGLRSVIVGLEACTDGELDAYNKNSSVENNEKAIKILQENGVECYGTIILGLDWAAADFRRLVRWLKQNGMIFVNLQPFTPLPGTPLFAEYEDKLLIPRQECEKWDLAHLVVAPRRLSVRQYYWQMLKAY